MTVPPPVEITRRRAGEGSAGPSSATAARSRPRNAGLAVAREDVGDRPAGRALDGLVEVQERRAVPRGQPPAHDALAAPRQPDEHDVHRRPQSSPPRAGHDRRLRRTRRQRVAATAGVRDRRVPAAPSPATGVGGACAIRSR